eukprot:gb/GECH01014759.1/.p1 GENE.gb/GECH01014759.1/~~gb/GECH01014759.1/.p1  ORF type:complete len:222 (+),score=27.94 gb/GECH01014759.1/:1-666(+)
MRFFGALDKNKTFRSPKTKYNRKGSRGYSLHHQAKATLGTGDLAQAVQLPAGEPLNDWLAVNTVDFYNTANLLYGVISEFCTPESCPKMTAGSYEYLWKDGKRYKRATSIPAKEYVSLLMDWIDATISDETIFPSKDDLVFPKDFQKTCKNLYKRLFRVYAHMYYSHYEQIKDLEIEAHFNTSFKHFMLFVFEFELVDRKELQVLKEVIIELCGNAYRDRF